MKTFKLHRSRDVSGVSGEGYVAEGMITSYGEVVMRWYGVGITIFPSIQDLERIHGHGGLTVVEIVTDDGIEIQKGSIQDDHRHNKVRNTS